MTPDPAALQALGYLSPLDRHFAESMARLAHSDDPRVALGAAVASRFVAHGHVCADLASLAGAPVELPETGAAGGDLRWPDLDPWTRALTASRLVGDGSGPEPLVLRGRRLYLARYHDLERRLVRQLLERAEAEPPPVDAALLETGLDRLFGPATDDNAAADQRRAAAVALRRRLTVISGGPGTGKTSTVVRLLALLVEQADAAGRPRPRIAMAAPTGKAAARLGEAVSSALVAGGPRSLQASPSVRAAIPAEASTIHRLLGVIPDGPRRFHHDADHPLPLDVLVVDEASMIDLALMTRLAEAVPPEARLLLLGDRDQLASVEAGAILGDICAGGPGDAVVELRHSFRFGPESGIRRLADAVNRGDAAAVLEVLRGDEHVDVALVAPPDDGPLGPVLAPLVREGYAPLLRRAAPADGLRSLDRFRVLCAHRRGLAGVEAVNPLCERTLARAGGLVPRGPWYAGRPVMVTSNDRQLRLFNGDVGLVDAGPDGALRAFFPGPDGELRSLAPTRLPRVETVFATTIHKSQGSEYDHVLVVLPRNPSPITTRELLYTAITRARRRVTVCASTRSIATTVAKTTWCTPKLLDPLRGGGVC